MKAVKKLFNVQTKMVGLLGFTAVLGLLATACSKNDGGGAPPPIPVAPVVATGAGGYGVPTCSGCPTSPTFIASGVADASSGSAIVSELNLYFYGNPVTTTGNQIAGTSASPYYGPVSAAGRFYLAQALPNCNVPAGNYTFTTSSPGIFGANGIGTSFDNITLTVNGAPMQLLVSGDLQPQVPPSTGQDNQTYGYRMMMTTFIVKRTDTYAYCNLSLELN